MAHLEGQPPLSSQKDAYISGIYNIEKLEALEKEQAALLQEAEANIAALQECFYRYNAAMSLKWHTRKMLNKIRGKLKNLKRVQRADFKVETWYDDPNRHHGGGTYIYPLRVTPAGRVEVIEFIHYKERHNWNYKTQQYQGWTGPYWKIQITFMDSAELERIAPLTVLVTVGNLNRLLKAFRDTKFYEQCLPQAHSNCVYMDVKDTGDFKDFEILEHYPQIKE